MIHPELKITSFQSYIYKIENSYKMDVKAQPTLKFIDEPVYIHKITNKLGEFHTNVDDTLYVMSIDIGIHHLGMSMSLVDKEYKLKNIIWIDLINITEYVHVNGPSKESCELYHTKTFCDWMNHHFQENRRFYEMADFILVERQPPMGFVVIEQLIFSKWREKTILISPNSMHKYFGIGGYDYEKRKELTDKIARNNITNETLLEKLGLYPRTHDIADSICIMLFWIHGKHEKYIHEQNRKRIMGLQTHMAKHGRKISNNKWFEIHRYIPR